MKCEDYAAKTRKLNPINDDLFKKMAEDVEFRQETSRVTLGVPQLQIVELMHQDSVKNLQNHLSRRLSDSRKR